MLKALSYFGMQLFLFSKSFHLSSKNGRLSQIRLLICKKMFKLLQD